MTTFEVPDDLADEQRPRWWQRWRQHADDEPEADVVQLRKAPLPALVEDPEPEPSTAARQMLERLTARPFPTRRQLRRSTVWWARKLRDLIPRLPMLLMLELLPIARGIGKVATGWARWCQCVELAEAVKEAKENERSKASERLTKRRSARTWASAVVLAAATGGAWWLSIVNLVAFVAAAVLVGAVLDVIGRRANRTVEKPLAPAMPSILHEGVPLRQITASILATFTREGFEEDSVRVAQPLRWDEDRREYRISLSTHDAIKPEHIRAVERAVGAKDYAIRNLATSTSTVRDLVIRVGDPLSHVDVAPWIATGTRSIVEALDLGASAGDQPFALRFAGAHVAIIGQTGAGKTKGAIWTIIDRLSACRDVVLWGIDLAAGPALPMWRGVIQQKAFNVADAEVLLDAVIAEIDRRMRILTELAEDDDPDNDADEWHTGLGPALITVIDEFALLAEQDGVKGKADLLGRVEQVERTGRKVWVSVIMGTQKSGNSDFGSTTTSTQVAIKILLACDEADTVRLLSVAHRDAGWAPHHLSPAVEGDVRDAGKCYIESPAHRTPDIYRTYAPMSPGEVKRRARQRVADGLPSLDRCTPSGVVDAVEVPPLLAAVEAAFRDSGQPDRMATADLLAWLRDAGRGLDEDSKVAGAQLAEQLRPYELRPEGRWRPTPGANSIRGYLLADVRAAIERLS